MSRPLVPVFVGQCGARIGEHLLEQTNAGSGSGGNANGHGASTSLRLCPGPGVVAHEFTWADGENCLAPWRARSVFVDSEPRSVSRVRNAYCVYGDVKTARKKKTQCALHRESIICSRGGGGGRGNVWAHGYAKASEADAFATRRKREALGKPRQSTNYDVAMARGYAGERIARGSLHSDAELVDAALDRLRHEVEMCCASPDFLLCLGTGGGTGAGVGSRLLEEMRAEFGFAGAGSIAVAACVGGGGEHYEGFSPLEAYNSVLSIQWLQCYADSVLLFDNNVLMKELSSGAQRRADSAATERVGTPDRIGAGSSRPVGPHIEDASMRNLNRYIATSISRLFTPIEYAGTDSRTHTSIAAASPVLDFTTTVCPLPSARFAEVRTSDFPGDSSDRQSLANRSGQSTSVDWLKAETTRILRASRFDPIGSVRASDVGAGVDGIPRVTSAMTLARVLGFESSAAGTTVDGVSRAVEECVARHSIIQPWAAGCDSASIDTLDARGGIRSGVSVRVSPRVPVGLGFSPKPANVAFSSSFKKPGAARSVVCGPSISIASCRSSTRSLLDRVNDRCSRLLSQRAYTQYYESYACPSEAIGDALEVSRSVADSYASLGL